jgi:hypothetical protein
MFKNKITCNFIVFVATKNGRTKKFFPSFEAVVESGIQEKKIKILLASIKTLTNSKNLSRKPHHNFCH